MTSNPSADIQSWVSGELPRSPYPGLRPFEMDEWQIFFGREAITDEVIEQLISQHVVSVHGSSGSGKSSLVRAGIMPRLKQDHANSGLTWRNCAMVPGNAPLRNLAEALASLDEEASPAERVDRVLEIRRLLNRGSEAGSEICRLLRRGPRDHLCILVDQFEELFRFANTNRAEALLFVEVLVAIAENPPAGLYAMLTMRSDYLGDCARFPDLAQTVNRTQYLLPRMNYADLLRAVREPAELYGGWVSPELAERVIADASAEQDELPLIQHGLMVLWRDAAGADGSQKERRLDLADYTARRGLGPILSDHADGIVAKAAPDEARQKVVERLFRALTDTNADRNGIRRPQRFSDLCAVTGASAECLRDIIDFFRAEGVSFLRPYEKRVIDPNDEIDISHEALIRCWHKIADRKDGWLQREFRDGLIWRALLVAADGYEADPTNVLGPTATDERDRWLTNHNVAWSRRYGNEWDRVQRLMAASREDRDRRRQEQKDRDRAILEAKEARAAAAEARATADRRRVWLVAAAAGLMGLVTIGMGFYAWWSSREADRVNNELANTLWSQLEFKERSLLPSEVTALWDLTFATSAVHQIFWSKLTNPEAHAGSGAPRRSEQFILKFGVRPEHLTRTAGLESERVAFALSGLLTVLQSSKDLKQLATLTRALLSFPVDLNSAQVDIALAANLHGLQQSVDPAQLRTFAGNLEATVRKLSLNQLDTAFRTTFNVLRSSTDQNQLAACVRVLGALSSSKGLASEHIKVAQDGIAEDMRGSPNPYQLKALINTARALSIEFTPEQVQAALDLILRDIQKTTNLSQQLELVNALEQLVLGLPPDQIAALLDRLVKVLSGSSATQGGLLVRVLQPVNRIAAKWPQLVGAQNQALLEVAILGLRTSNDPSQLRTFVAALKELVPKLAPSQVHAAFNATLDSLSNSTNRSRLSALVEALRNIGTDLAPAQVDLALKTVLKILQTSIDPDQLPASVQVLNMIASKLTPTQIQIVTDAMLEGLHKSKDPDQLIAYADVLEKLAPLLAPELINKVVESVLRILAATSELDNLTAVFSVLNAFRIELPPAQLDVAHTAVMQGLRNSIDPEQLRTFVSTFLSYASRLNAEQIGTALDSILEGLRTSTDYDQLPALVQVLEVVVKKLTPEQVQATRERVAEDLGASTNSYQLREFVSVTRLLGVRAHASSGSDAL